jgi:hypothetical protein
MFSLPTPRIHVRKYPRSMDKSLSRYIEFITTDTHTATTTPIRPNCTSSAARKSLSDPQ